MKRSQKLAGLLLLVLFSSGVLVTATFDRLAAQDNGAAKFKSPAEAVAALIDAARSKDASAVATVLGPGTKEWLVSGDPVQDTAGRARFVAAYDAKHEIVNEDGDKAVLVVGTDGFPFPFPIVKSKAGWSFDLEQGKEELLNRRIGENELNTVQVLLAIVDAQREYAEVDRDGDGLLVYAAKFASTPGKRDGLFWARAEGEAESPLGPLVAQAAREGYSAGGSGGTKGESVPYHGYKFRILTGQGAKAEGGAFDYMVGDKMFGGFAVIAFPAKYDASGIMTFIVNHDGVVYETDLGPETQRLAQDIKTYNPDETWRKTDGQP